MEQVSGHTTLRLTNKCPVESTFPYAFGQPLTNKCPAGGLVGFFDKGGFPVTFRALEDIEEENMGACRYTWLLRDDTHAPTPGLGPTWATLKYVDDGTDVPSPSTTVPITDLGGGIYKAVWDPIANREIVGVVDGGAAVTDKAERYQYQRLGTWQLSGDIADLVEQILANKRVENAAAIPSTEQVYARDGVTPLKSWETADDGSTRTRTPLT